MSVEVKVPQLGISMTEGTLLDWLVGDGETIEQGQPLYNLETEKIETEVEAPSSGVVRLIGVEGETYLVGDLIAEIN